MESRQRCFLSLGVRKLLYQKSERPLLPVPRYTGGQVLFSGVTVDVTLW